MAWSTNAALEYKKRMIKKFFAWKQREQVPDWWIEERISFNPMALQRRPDIATQSQIRTIRALMETSVITLELLRQGKVVRSGPTKEDKKYCDRCVHWKPVTGEDGYACHFLLDIGHSRKCPPGVGCKMRETRRFGK